MSAYYNEHDAYAAAWLRNLIDAGHIAPGVVDERSIVEVRAADLEGYDQFHFFAGIGVWSHALRLAGWPDDRPVWTGSCPCQPFSSAGKRKGNDDERHLWPHFFRLIQECRPAVVLGEQVASEDGLGWLDVVSADLEGAGYAVGAADLCAAGIGAPHIRQRLWFVGLGVPGSDDLRRDGGAADRTEAEGEGSGQEPGTERVKHAVSGGAGGLGKADCERREGQRLQLCERGSLEDLPEATGDGERRILARFDATEHAPQCSEGRDPVDWVLCRDPGGPRWRPVEPGTFPLAHGAPACVGRLRAYGNAIVAPLAQTWIEAVIESISRRCSLT